jgi:hypothetical protein
MKDLIIFDPDFYIPDGNNPPPLTTEQKNSVVDYVIKKAGKMEGELRKAGCKIHVIRSGESFKTRLVCRNPSDSLTERYWDLVES